MNEDITTGQGPGATGPSGAEEWVVVATWCEEGEWQSEVVREGFATEGEAEEAACDVVTNLGSYYEQEQQGVVEVCTREQAEATVTR